MIIGPIFPLIICETNYQIKTGVDHSLTFLLAEDGGYLYVKECSDGSRVLLLFYYCCFFRIIDTVIAGLQEQFLSTH